MSDLVVNLSGVLQVEEMEGKTADQLIDLAVSVWNLPKESIHKPFVVVHNSSNNKYDPKQGQDLVGNLPQNAVVRVILPLKAEVAAQGSKQYLVEEE